MITTPKLLKTAQACGCIAVLAFIASSEIRTRNLGAEVNLIYDASSCCLPGRTKIEVRHCFESRGYAPRRLEDTTDMIPPNLLLGGFSFRETSVDVKYGADGKFSSYSLAAVMSAL